MGSMFVRDPGRDRKTNERTGIAPDHFRDWRGDRGEKHRRRGSETRCFACPRTHQARLSEEKKNLYHGARETISCRKEEEMEEKEMTLKEAMLEISEAISPSKITLRLEETTEGLARNGMIILALSLSEEELLEAVEKFQELWRSFDDMVSSSKAALSVEALALEMDEATALTTPWPYAQTGGEDMVGKTIGDVLEENKSLVFWLSCRDPRPGNRMERKAIAAAIRLVQPEFRRRAEEETAEFEF